MTTKQDPYASEEETKALLEAQTFTGLPKRKLSELVSAGWNINGVSIEREEGCVTKRGAVTTGGMVLWWHAEQPAQQEPVNQRAHEMALRQWDHWKQCALELQEKLVKYEGGSPMVLNAAPQPAQQEPVADRAFLERVLAAMEGVIDVADRKTNEFDVLRACIVDLTLMLHSPQTAQPQQEPAKPQQSCYCLNCEELSKELAALKGVSL